MASPGPVGHVREILSDTDKADPTGELVGRNAHQNLIISIGEQNVGHRSRDGGPFLNQIGEATMGVSAKNRSPDGEKAIKEKKKKDQEYMTYGHWPWWRYHNSEKEYWSDKHSEHFWYRAARWRLSRDYWLSESAPELKGPYKGMTREQALASYEQGWIDMYGQDQHDKAMRATEEVYQEVKKTYGDYLTFKWHVPDPRKARGKKAQAANEG